MRNKWFITESIGLLVISLLWSCTVERPESVLSESKMEDILYDYHIAKALGESLPIDEKYKRPAYNNAVFLKHNITEASFDSSMVWYTRNIKILAKIYEKVSNRLSTQQKQINQLVAIREKRTVTSEPGDSVDVWSWQNIIPLTSMPVLNKYTFYLPSDTNFHDRDTLKWSADYQFLNAKPSDLAIAEISMQITYENDSTIQTDKIINSDGSYSIYLQSDTLGKISKIQGSIYFSSIQTDRTLLIHNIHLERYHTKDTLLPAKKDSLKLTKQLNSKEGKVN